MRIPQEDRDGVIAVYQALNGRYSSNTTLQWQIPLYVLPVQAALIVGITAAEGYVALALGVVGGLLGVLGAPVMWRIESVARWDRQALDEFESVLLPSRYSFLRLMHSAHFNDRTKRKPLRMGRSRFARFIERKILRFFPPSRVISGLLVLVGLIACGVAVDRYVETPRSHSRQGQEPGSCWSRRTQDSPELCEK